MAKLSDLDRIQREDHDALVRIEANLANLSTDLKIMGDGLNKRVSDHELRIQKIETIFNQIDPLQFYKEFRTLQQDQRDFMTTANTWRIIGGMLGGAVLFIFTQVPNWWRNIFHK